MLSIHFKQIKDATKQTLRDHHRMRKIGIRVLIALVILGVIAALAFWAKDWVGPIEDWIQEQGFWAPILFAIVFFLLVLVFVPEAVPSMAAGALFGLWWGWIFIIVVGVISAIILFFLARYVLRKPVERMMAKHPKLAAVDRATGREGFKIMVLLRLAPIAFTPLCYILGATRVTFGAYCLALVGMFPGNFVTAYYGTAVKHVARLASGHEQESPMYYVMLFVGLVAAIAAVAVVAHVARRALKNAVVVPEPAPGDSIAGAN